MTTGGKGAETMALTSPSTIHVGPIVAPGSNETISIVIPLSAQLTTVPSQVFEQVCKDCGKDITVQAIESSPACKCRKNVKGCPFPTCTRYGRAFSRAHDLKRHIARHELRKEERHLAAEKVDARSCLTCDLSFTDKTVRQSHVQIHCKSEDLQKSSVDVSWFSCHLCKKRYTHESKLKAHLSIHDKKSICNICALCGSRFNDNEELENHVKEHTTNIVQAQATLSTLNALISRNNLEEGSNFSLAEMLLLNKDTNGVSLERNNSSANLTSKKIRCDYCSKTFKSKWTLNSHVAAHEGRFQFDCNQCGKKFVRKSHFEGHLRSHEVARPYVCEQCGKSFKELKHRREHSKRKHPRNQNAIQNLLDSISACVSEESSADQAQFTLLMPMNYNV